MVSVNRKLAWAIVALGAFGFIIPFVGPLFNFGMGPDPAFAITSARVVRHVIPGAGAIIGGLMLLSSGTGARRWGGILAIAGSAWLAVGPFMLQTETVSQFSRRSVYHSGTGLALVILAAYALGRLSRREEADLSSTVPLEDREHTEVHG